MPLSYPEVFESSVDLHRSNHRRCSKAKDVLHVLAKFTGKHFSQSLFFDKVAGMSAATLLKERLWYRCFSCEFCKTFKNAYFEEHI